MKRRRKKISRIDYPLRTLGCSLWSDPVASSPIVSGVNGTIQIGSFALFGMYLVVKYLGKEWINFLLGWYFAITGVASVWKVCSVPIVLY
jgi:hypothetical protein